MRIYFGGAFDPPTVAHGNILEKLIKGLDVRSDKLLIGVTDHSYKQPPLFPLPVRMLMLNQALEYILTDQVDRQHVRVVVQDRRTWDFLQQFPPMKRPDRIVVGSDEMADLYAGKWEHSEELLKTYSWQVERRTNVSSTECRQLLLEGFHSVYDLYPPVRETAKWWLETYYKEQEKQQ